MKFLKIIIPLIIVLVLSYWVFKPLLIPGFFPIHDDTQASRVFEMTKSLKDGMFPVRWVPDLGYGYGYPIFNFYAPLAYYVGSAFMFFGLDALIATKIMMSLGIIFSGIFMYLLGKEFWGKLGGIVSAVFYLYAPFHAVDIYVRGDVAEFWAYAFIPLAFLGIYKVFKSKGSFGWVIVSAFSYAGIILFHNLTAMMVSPFIVFVALILIYCAFRKKEKHVVYSLLISLGLGLVLSAFYFLPALQEQKYTDVISQIGVGANFRDHFVCFSQLWQSQWGFGGSAPGCFDGFSFMIGKLHIITSLLVLALTVIFISLKKISKENEKVKIIILSSVGLLISVSFMLSISEPVWKSISLMAFFQYPWRFLIMTSFFSSVLSGALVWLTVFVVKTKWAQYGISLFLVFLVIFLNGKFFVPQTIVGKTSADYTSPAVLKWTISKISDEYMPKNFPKPSIEKNVVTGRVALDSRDAIAKSEIDKTQNIILSVDVLRETTIYFNIAYFPAWKTFIDNKEIGYEYKNGRYSVSVPTGNHTVSIEFVQTPIERVSNVISLAGVLLLALGIIGFRKKLFYGKN